jgi:2-polyprenyl-3-methyl-5-hydroxy-6-metoxy-1,4-benzoquinol methylase
MANSQTKNVSYPGRLARALKSRISDFLLLLRCLRPGLIWLYQNRHLRMDANVKVNDPRRRDFHKDRYLFASGYIKNLQLKAGSVILDAACGTGYGTDILKNIQDVKIIGVDISSEAIAYATRKYGGDRCVFKQGDVKVLADFSPDSFDAVVSFETIEHIDQPLVFLERLKCLLKPGGVLILSTPNKWGPTKDHKFDYDYNLLLEHVKEFLQVEEVFAQNSGCQELWINRGACRRIVKADQNSISTAECFIAVCRKN